MSGIIPLEDEVVNHKLNELKRVLTELSEIDYVSIKDIEDDEESLKKYSNEFLDKYADEFRKIYDDGAEFRHMYSTIFPLIDKIKKGGKGNLDILVNNMYALRIYVRDRKLIEPGIYSDRLYSAILKLDDHLTIEYQRYNNLWEVNGNLDEISSKTKELQSYADDLIRKCNGLEDQFKSIQGKVYASQAESITILGIFAAIVMAFTGGLSFLGGSISEVASADLSDLSRVVALCGIIMFDVVAVMMRIIWRIVENPCSRKDDKTNRNFWILVFLFNVFMLSLMVGITIFW